MKPKLRNLLLIIGAAGLVFLLLWFPNLFGQKERRPVKKQVLIEPPQIESQVPYLPQRVNLEPLTAKGLPKTLTVYKISGEVLLKPSYAQAADLGRALGFGPPQSRPAYGGGMTYIFTNSLGGTLVIKDNPFSLNYSEPDKRDREIGLPSLPEAEERAADLVSRLNLGLPDGWQVKVIRRVFLTGGLGSAREVTTVGQANLVKITLGYFYQDFKVVSERGNPEFIEFIYDNYGSLISFKLTFLVNNPQLKVEKTGDFKAKNLEEINQSFVKGEARAVSLDLLGVVSDEPILNPPTAVSASQLDPVLVLDGNLLYPYYLIGTAGRLSSGRVGRVLYLVPAVIP